MIDIVKMIQAANKSFLEWKKSTVEERLQFLQKITEQYLLKKDEIILSESLDQGLSLDFTRRANFEMGLKILEDLKRQLQQSQDNQPVEHYFPNGVVSVILSWNLSNRLLIEKALPALLAGNTVIIKVSSAAISTAQVWKQVFSVLPEHVVQFVITDDSECKKLLVTHPGIKAVTMMGTLENCAQVLKNQSVMADKQFKKVQLACGSKNSCVVLEEPNTVLVHQVLESFLMGQGQLVWNSSRLFILEKHQAAWIEAISETFKKLQPAESVDDPSLWRPVVKKYSGLSYSELKTIAQNDQAKLITAPEHKNLLSPFFTYDMSNCSELQQDELKLPIFVLSAVKYGFDVPKYSNVSYYGHSANIFSQGNLDKIINQLDVGYISVNQWSIYREPYIKAVKQSAHGIQDHQIFGGFHSNVKIIS